MLCVGMSIFGLCDGDNCEQASVVKQKTLIIATNREQQSHGNEQFGLQLNSWLLVNI